MASTDYEPKPPHRNGSTPEENMDYLKSGPTLGIEMIIQMYHMLPQLPSLAISVMHSVPSLIRDPITLAWDYYVLPVISYFNPSNLENCLEKPDSVRNNMI